MREKIMMVLAIAVFASVPMVQLVTADSLLGHPGDGNASFLVSSLQRGPNLDTYQGRFNLPAAGGSRYIDQGRTTPSEIRTRINMTPKQSPLPSHPVFPAPTPYPAPAPVPPLSPLFISDLKVAEDCVMITNKGDDRVCMTGWRVANSQGKSITFIDYPVGGGAYFTYTLPPRSTLTIHSGVEGTPSMFHLYWPEEMWNDSGDTAYLYNPEGKLVSSLSR